MSRVHVTGGYLNVEGIGIEGPVDPGWGVGGGRPDNSLPPGFPPIGDTLPEPPPGVWPPLTPSAPIQPAHPIAGHPVPPGTIWPPVHPPHPDQGLPGGRPPHVSGGPAPGGGRPDNTLPGGPVRPDQGLPSNTFWIVAGIPGVGWRYVCVDPSLTVGYPLPSVPARPDQGLPPTPQPKG
jgi:hypothetical protein